MNVWLWKVLKGWRVGVVQGWPSAAAQGVGSEAEAVRRLVLGPAPCKKRPNLPQDTRA